MGTRRIRQAISNRSGFCHQLLWETTFSLWIICTIFLSLLTARQLTLGLLFTSVFLGKTIHLCFVLPEMVVSAIQVPCCPVLLSSVFLHFHLFASGGDDQKQLNHSGRG